MDFLPEKIEHYSCNHTQEEYFFNEKVTIPSKQTISIPLHHMLTSDETDYIIDKVKQYWR